MSNNSEYNRHNQQPGPHPPSEYYGQQGSYQREGGAAGESFGAQHGGAYGTASSSSQLSSYSQSSGGNQRRRRRGGLIGGIVRGVASGIGLASESYHHHQEKKEKKKAAAAAAEESSRALEGDGQQSRDSSRGFVDNSHDSNHHDDEDDSSSDEYDGPEALEASRNMDEATWQLDDAQFEIAPPPDYATVTEQDIDMMADRFVQNHGSLPHQQQPERHGLPMPVILPQRRPGERSRGFIHAYAPLLQDTGIDQATFMDFIRNLNLATMPSPWINAINVATLAVQNVPLPVMFAVSIAANYATKIGLQAHSRSKTNTFLDKMNAEFFRPRGLIAVVLTWKPSRTGEILTQVTFDEALGRATQNATATGGFGHKMQASHATTAFEWPESAPLVFPSLDKAASTAEGRAAVEEAAKKPNAVLGGMIFAMEYMDKRAQAQWATDNPDSRLAQLGVKPEFHSRYADPNHPASSGSLLALLTGGAISGKQSQRRLDRGDRRQARRDQKSARREDRRAQKGPTVLSSIGPFALIRGVKKFINEDVLYLMIANLPSDEEMAMAQQFLNQHPQQGVRW